MNAARWFSAIPLPYDGREAFLERDAGQFCRGFQSLGSDARLVCLGDSGELTDRPIVLANEADLGRADWWARWGLEGVVLFSWALERYTPIARAIRSAGAKVVIKLDSDGIRLPHVWPSRYWRLRCAWEREFHRPLPAVSGTLKTLYRLLFGKRSARSVVRHLEHADLITIESPLTRQRYLRFLELMGAAHLSSRLAVLPHPVASHMAPVAGQPREKLILCVGRWNSHIKGGPLLIEVLGRVLSRRADYRAQVIGPHEEELVPQLARWPAGVRSRIELTGRLPAAELPRRYSAAQISLCTSHSESFHIASAEALACGCSVVGPVQIGSMPSFCSDQSGTLACDRNPANFQDAVMAEIEAWAQGERDPAHISERWRARVSVEAVVRRMLEQVSAAG